jgi:hypothetical protein
MNDFSDWFDNNWIDLARLLVQCGILTAVVWYSRKMLKTLRASQEQIGALLRLSVSEGATREHSSSIAEPALAPPGFTAPSSAPADSPTAPSYGFSAHSPMASHPPEREQTLGGRVAMERTINETEPLLDSEMPTLTPWVAAPAVQHAEPTEGLAARMADSRRNLGRLLKDSPQRSQGVNPFRRMIRWLQAPAGH